MTMRSSAFASGGCGLETDKIEPCNLIVDVHDVVGDMHDSSGQQHSKYSRKPIQSHVSKAARTPVAAGQNKAGAALGQEDTWVSLGALTALGKQMGGEGTPVRNKTLAGETDSIMSKTDPSVVNVHFNRDAHTEGGGVEITTLGVVNAASVENSWECRWKNVRKGPSHTPAQATCIRQILLLQLDLIEQQQQQLLSKEKEIDGLKADKQTLLAQIERMERRLQLVKDTRDKQPILPLEQEAPGAEPETPEREEPPSDCHSYTPKLLRFGRGGKGHKRRFCFLDSKAAKSRGRRFRFSQQGGKEQAASFQRELRSKEAPGRPTNHMDDLPYLYTTEMYLSRWRPPPPCPLREISPRKDETVTIPSWREKRLEPLGVRHTVWEIPENLDDGVFLKRHMKLELDEKRRKRWDIQRIREQRMCQKLQQRSNRKKVVQESEPGVLSFYPDTEDVESVMITPFLPVVAFGRPLPKISQRSFHLPWVDGRSRSRAEAKQTLYRSCRR